MCVRACVRSAFTPQFTQCSRWYNCHGRFPIRSWFDLCYYMSTVNIGHLHCTFYFCISMELREFQLCSSIRPSSCSCSRPNRPRERTHSRAPTRALVKREEEILCENTVFIYPFPVYWYTRHALYPFRVSRTVTKISHTANGSVYASKKKTNR